MRHNPWQGNPKRIYRLNIFCDWMDGWDPEQTGAIPPHSGGLLLRFDDGLTINVDSKYLVAFVTRDRVDCKVDLASLQAVLEGVGAKVQLVSGPERSLELVSPDESAFCRVFDYGGIEFPQGQKLEGKEILWLSIILQFVLEK